MFVLCWFPITLQELVKIVLPFVDVILQFALVGDLILNFKKENIGPLGVHTSAELILLL